ncbi:MAG: tyrosine--tRNA ligase [Candidatus Woesearchaeota archaeon]|nr:tyrosine--tRNA ligase [Candidatus Woesearchaeota archaeon]
MINTNSEKIDEILKRGVEEVIERESLEKKLKSGKKLRIKLGIDPTSPNMHVGRAIPLLKLKDFQKLGHKIVLIIGDFTGIIGDTSDKESERPMLDTKTIKENMKTYAKQAGKILDMKKCELRYNSSWLKKLGFVEIGRMADLFGLHEFESRENISLRLREGKRVSVRELLYPIMQGYDSVAVKADVELGGTDQRFNLLSGREIQRYYNQEPQNIMTNPLIEGTDGRKMSSSRGNTINLLDNAKEMFGKTMSLPDELIIKYFLLTTRLPMSKIEEIKKMSNPRDQKSRLAYEIVKMYHGEKEAQKTEDEFNKTFRDKNPTFTEFKIEKKEVPILDLLVETNLTPSKNEAKRLILQKAVKINGEVQEDWQKIIKIVTGTKIQVGPRKFLELI